MDRRLSPRLVAGLAVAVGLLHGWLNGVSLAQAQREGLGLAGIASAAVRGRGDRIGTWSSSLRVPWTRIAVRVAGELGGGDRPADARLEPARSDVKRRAR